MYEFGGFIVDEFEEGGMPRKLFRLMLRKPPLS